MNSHLHYNKSGFGAKSLILFHGFGQTGEIFDSWIKPLKDDFTIYSFDLYYHGKSTRRDQPISLKEWGEDFGSFLNGEKIDQFHIASFSLGGRFAMVTTTLFPQQVQSLILVAPDGIFRSIWFKLATSRMGNPLFKYLMLHPKRFNQLLLSVKKLQLATSQMVRFAQKELSVKENRKKVYRSWTYFKPLQQDIDKFCQLVNIHQIKTHIILGSKDHIIPHREVLPKLNSLRDLNTHILDVKHHHLIEAAKTLVPSLLKGRIL